MSDPKAPGVEEGAVPFDMETEARLTASEEAKLRRAEAEADAGRVVPHSEVAKWLKTWGTPDEGPPPKTWFK